MGYTLVKMKGQPSRISGGGREGDILWDVLQRVEPFEVIGGKAVRDWPDGVTKIDDAVAQEFLKARA